MKIKNRIYFDYDDILSMCKDLVFQLETWKPDVIVGIKRGGVVPALHLSHDLEKPMEIVTWQTRDKHHQEHNKDLIKRIADGEKVVFVDDINDSGRTIKELEEIYYNKDADNVKFATLVQKTATIRPSDFRSLELGNKSWVVYPWEKV